MLTRYVTPHSFQTVCDDKSGYDHILLSERSRTFFGFQWAGCFFVSNTIPFGWKLSAYVYHSTGLLASHHFRSIGIPCSLYIDDRHTGQLMLQKNAALSGHEFLSVKDRNCQLARSAIFLVCYFLIKLGYTLGLQKSQLIPSERVTYLGFVVDSSLQAFCITSKKREKLLFLINSLLRGDTVSLLQLQKLAGKCTSLALAVPGARLFTCEINNAISRATRSSRPITISPALRSEIEHWLFLKSWTGHLPWREEKHSQVVLCSDASSFAWGGVLSLDSVCLSTSDY